MVFAHDTEVSLASTVALINSAGPPDGLAGLVHSDDPDERKRRLARLTVALHEFDTATISTIHGFCTGVLSAGGLHASQLMETTVIGTETDVIREVCADLLFNEASERSSTARLPELDSLASMVARARGLGDCRISAESGDPDDLLRQQMVNDAMEMVSERLRTTGLMTFDRLIRSVDQESLQPAPGVLSRARPGSSRPSTCA